MAFTWPFFLALFVIAHYLFRLLAASDCCGSSKRRRGNSKLAKWDLLSGALVKENLLKRKRKVGGEAGEKEDQDTNCILFETFCRNHQLFSLTFALIKQL